MSKNAIISTVIGVLFILAAIGIVISLNMNSAKVSNTKTGQTTTVKTGHAAYVAVDACDVLTEAAAKKILGDGATKADVSAGNASSAAVSVSNCIYTVKIDPNAIKPNNTNGVSVLARAAKSQEGADSNQAQFSTNKPAGTQDVDDLGDKAYYNPKFGQLNVLQGNNWYIVTNYQGSATNATLESDTALAKELKFK